MIKGLVNILTPSYNSAKFLPRLLDSVLSQTYPNVEMFIIDDGSTDNTKELVNSYVEKFNMRGYGLNYVYQDNQGQSSAINNGLKLLNGEYLLWPDSDDWYKTDRAISRLITALSDTDDSVGIVRCRYEYLNEDSMKIIKTSNFPNDSYIEDLTDDAISHKNGFAYEPGGYAIKLKFLDQLIPQREIYTSRDTGQNVQLLLPYILNTKCLSLDEVLFCYLVRKQSHSRGSYQGFEKEKIRTMAHIENFVNTIKNIENLSESKRNVYIDIIRSIYDRRLYRSAIAYNRPKEIRKYYKRVKDEGILISKKEIILGLSSFFFPFYFFMRACFKMLDIAVGLKKYYLSLIVFLLLFLSLDNYIPRLVRLWYKYSYTAAKTENPHSFEMLVRDGTISLLNRDNISDGNIIYQRNLTSTFFNEKKSVFEFGEYGLLLHWAYLYAQIKNDNELERLVKEKFDGNFNDNWRLERSDQVTYGNVAIDLFKKTRDKRYKRIADLIYNYIKTIDNSKGLVVYRANTQLQDVDAIGLVCPFLYYYASEFDSITAKDIADRMIVDYSKWGADKVTGFPVQTYNVESHVKLNRSNWGRGLSWYLLGSLASEQSVRDLMDISKLDSLLISNNDSLYMQYYKQGVTPDMSATIPVLFYMNEKNYSKWDKEDLWRLLEPYFDNHGIMRFCSPSISMPLEKVNEFQTSMCFQALALYFLGKVD